MDDEEWQTRHIHWKRVHKSDQITIKPNKMEMTCSKEIFPVKPFWFIVRIARRDDFSLFVMTNQNQQKIRSFIS